MRMNNEVTEIMKRSAEFIDKNEIESVINLFYNNNCFGLAYSFIPFRSTENNTLIKL